MNRARPLVNRTLAVRLLKWQLLLAVALIMAALLSGWQQSLAIGLGAGIALVGNAFFTLRTFARTGGTPQELVQDFYRGEAGKLILTILLFAAVFISYKAVRVPWLFTGFILEQFVVWLVPLVAGLRGER